jgi:hypothetical protein
MKTMKKTLMLVAGVLGGMQAMADFTVYTEDFNLTAGNDAFGGVGLYSYGYDAGASYKRIDNDEWASNSAANNLSGGVAQPAFAGGTSSKYVGVFLNPSNFTQGSGTYTLHFDVIGDAASGNRNTFAFIYGATGFDTSGSNDLILDVSEVNLLSGNPVNGTGNTVVTQLAKSSNINSTLSTADVTLNFVYTEGQTVGIAFGSIGSDVEFDNVSITTTIPEPATLGLVVAFGTSVIFVRRLMM